MPTASSPSGSSRDRDRDWIGARQSTVMVVWSSNRPARCPLTSAPSASRSGRVSSRKCCSVGVAAVGDQVGGGLRRRACHSCGMVVSAHPVGAGGVAGEVADHLADGGLVGRAERRRAGSRPGRGSAAASGRTRSPRGAAPPARGSRVQPLPSGPKSSGLIRAGRPWPTASGSTPSARHSGSYSSLTSPRISVR